MGLEILQTIYNQKFHNALHRTPQKVPPIWMMRQAGRYHRHYQNLKSKYTFEQLCREPELACEVTLGPIQEFDFDAAILFSDILFPLDYLGMELEFNPGPMFKKNLSLTMVENYSLEEFNDYIQFQNKALKLLRQELPNDKSLIGFIGGPFTLFHFATRHNPTSEDLFKPTLKTLEIILKQNIEIQFENDLDLLMIFDTEANNLSDLEFEKVVLPFLKDVCQKYPNKIGYFTKNISPSKFDILKKILGLQLTVLGSNFNILTELKETNLTLQGNFSNDLLALQDTDDFTRVLDEFIEYCTQPQYDSCPGWIASLDHGVQKTTPETNIHLFIEKIRTKLA
jgi:uroporphyrinogen decarboxylase